MTRVIACCIAVALAGCSFFSVHGPDIAPGTMPAPGDEIDCSESRVAPIIDLVAGTLILLGGISAFIDSRDPNGRPHAGEAALALSSVGILFGISAVVGFNRISECKRVRELYMR
jgi:hypothetical protein